MAEPRIQRILVALDASPASLAALECAARLAAILQAELLGLYVEDETLLKGADLPMTRAVGSFSGTARPIERRGIERHLRVQAAKAKQALESIAAQARLRHSFRIARGTVAAELLAAAANADLISLGRTGWSLLESRRIGTTTASVLSETRAPVLLLRRGLRMGQSVITVYDGSDAGRSGLRLAAQIARDDSTPLVVVLPAARPEAEQLKQHAEHQLEESGVRRSVQYRHVQHRDAALVGALAHAEDAGILILPTGEVFETRFRELLTQLDCPVLVVH